MSPSSFVSLCAQPYVVMGIVNVTPDSFSDGGEAYSCDAALRRIECLINEGADVIDIGAESSRPGAVPISTAEEMKRLEPLLSVYQSHFDVPFSLDTTKAEVARLGLNYGMMMLNDISALTADLDMGNAIRNSDVAVCLMHMQNSPQTMQDAPFYENVVQSVSEFLSERIVYTQSLGINQILVDPGIGFGKSLEHNLLLIKNLSQFNALNTPLLLGASRKSFIEKLTGDVVHDRVSGSISSAIMGLNNGASWFRVHDVLETKRALIVANAILEV